MVQDHGSKVMRGKEGEVNMSGNPAGILVAGLKCSGKTTFSGKLDN